MPRIIVDTNVIQYGVSEHFSDETAKTIGVLNESSQEMYISSYSAYEIYRGLENRKIERTKRVVDAFIPYDPELLTYKIAAVLTTCYQRHEATKQYASKYSDGDTIIAASAIRDGSQILTANANDFPAPFFIEVERHYITSKTTHVKIPVSILSPDYEAYFNARDTHYPRS